MIVSLFLQRAFAQFPEFLFVDNFSLMQFINSSSATNTAIFISDGAIVTFLNNSTAAEAPIDIDPTSTLNFNQSTSDTSTGALTDSGTINVNTNLTLSGDDSAFAGSTFVQTGSLTLLTTLGGDVTVEAPASITTSGGVGGDLLINDGTITPGSTIGTLQVGGNFSETANATYEVKISGAESSLIVVTGTGTLGGTLDLLSATSPTLTKYTIVQTTGGRVGTFSNFIQNPSLHFTLSYDANNAYLSLSNSNFTPHAKTFNQKQVARQIDSITDPTACETAFIAGLSSLSVAALDAALDNMAGEQYTHLNTIAERSDRRFREEIYQVLYTELTPCPRGRCCPRTNVWGFTGYQGGSFSNSINAKGYTASTWDVALGAFKWVLPELLVGLGGEYAREWIHFREGGKPVFSGGQAALYAAYNTKRAYLFSNFIAGYMSTHFKRPILFDSISEEATSPIRLPHGMLYVESGLNWDPCCSPYLLQPFVAFDIDYSRCNTVSEEGADCLDLNIQGKSIWDGSSYLGAHIMTTCGCRIAFRGDLAWRHCFGPHSINNETLFSSFGSPFLILGSSQGRNGVVGALDATYNVCNGIELNTAFIVERWRRWGSYEILGGINFWW